jgi:hypothetical protein
MKVEMILLHPGTTSRIRELEIIQTIKPYKINGGRCIHVSSEGIKCGDASRRDLSNGWLCTKHQEYISTALKLHRPLVNYATN